MKLEEALKIIKEKNLGYKIHFEDFLGTNYFPESNEEMILVEKYAINLAEKFAEATKDICWNIYVVNQKCIPILGYIKYNERK